MKSRILFLFLAGSAAILLNSALVLASQQSRTLEQIDDAPAAVPAEPLYEAPAAPAEQSYEAPAVPAEHPYEAPAAPAQQSYEPPAVQDEYVAPVIVYEEPVYLPPPIVVNYRYDYFVYENIGGFVNIVFYQNGRRFRSEPWHADGRRMTPMYIDSWRQTHRVERDKLEYHRRMLEQRHNIRHADTYYGVRPTQSRPAPIRQNMNQHIEKPRMQPSANQPLQQRGNPPYRQPVPQVQQQRPVQQNHPVQQQRAVQPNKPVQQRQAPAQQKPQQPVQRHAP